MPRGRKPLQATLVSRIDDYASNPDLLAAILARVQELKRPKGDWVFDAVTLKQNERLNELRNMAWEKNLVISEQLPRSCGEAAAMIGALEKALEIGKKPPKETVETTEETVNPIVDTVADGYFDETTDDFVNDEDFSDVMDAAENLPI
jgi:hypothetical protein